MTRRELWLAPAETSDSPESLWELLDLGVPEATEWMRHGLCAQTDPEVFFPGKGTPNREAKQVCAECPVRAACLEYALEKRLDYGVWGGMSAKERIVLRRQGHGVDRQVAA